MYLIVRGEVLVSVGCERMWRWLELEGLGIGLRVRIVLT